jgi:hypothetical protein
MPNVNRLGDPISHGGIALAPAVRLIFPAGDPDQPLIIGQMFHHQASPALSERGELPGKRYQSGIRRSREVRGLLNESSPKACCVCCAP